MTTIPIRTVTKGGSLSKITITMEASLTTTHTDTADGINAALLDAATKARGFLRSALIGTDNLLAQEMLRRHIAKLDELLAKARRP